MSIPTDEGSSSGSNVMALAFPSLIWVGIMIAIYFGYLFFSGMIGSSQEPIPIFNGIATVSFDKDVLDTFVNDVTSNSPHISSDTNSVTIVSPNGDVTTTFYVYQSEMFKQIRSLSQYIASVRNSKNVLYGTKDDIIREKNSSSNTRMTSSAQIIFEDGTKQEVSLVAARGRKWTVVAVSQINVDKAKNKNVRNWVKYMDSLKIVDDSKETWSINLFTLPFANLNNQ